MKTLPFLSGICAIFVLSAAITVQAVEPKMAQFENDVQTVLEQVKSFIQTLNGRAEEVKAAVAKGELTRAEAATRMGDLENKVRTMATKLVLLKAQAEALKMSTEMKNLEDAAKALDAQAEEFNKTKKGPGILRTLFGKYF